MPTEADCLFCKIVIGAVPAALVDRDDRTVAFLDHRPVFAGHTLIVPTDHYETLTDLPAPLVGPLFETVRRLSSAVQRACAADGTWVSMNNKVSQSVPHLHVHVVPRRRKDGLRGFYWPRQRYESDEQMHELAGRITQELTSTS